MPAFNKNNKTDYEEAGRQGEGISGLAFGDASNIASGLQGLMSQTSRQRALEARKTKVKRLYKSRSKASV